MKINIGDIVTIKCRNITKEGKVLYADNWIQDGKERWDIELESTKDSHYFNWKQEIDGGQVLKVNGVDYIVEN